MGDEDEDSDSEDDIDGGGMTPQMAARMIAQQQTAMKNKTGMRAMDSMKLIPTFKDADDDEDDDDAWSLEDETQLLTATLAQPNNLRTPIPITGRTISFGVLPDVFSTTSLKACTKGFSE